MANLWNTINALAKGNKAVEESLAKIEAFEITPVLKSITKTQLLSSDVSELPNVAPPFETYFMWARCAKGAEIGVTFRADKSHTGWSMHAWPVVLTGNDLVQSPYELSYNVDKDGKIAPKKEDGLDIVFSMTRIDGQRADFKDEEEANFVGHTMFCFVYPCLFATSILHCKNVNVQRVRPPEALAKAAQKRGRPLFSYSVLNVTPIGKSTSNNTPRTSSGSAPKMFHVCRGHFKDYREKGLFGNRKGIYWWNQSLKGDLSAGVHVKDYKVGA